MIQNGGRKFCRDENEDELCVFRIGKVGCCLGRGGVGGVGGVGKGSERGMKKFAEVEVKGRAVLGMWTEE